MPLETPVILVSGSLGCGKTTYMRSLVRSNPDVRFGVVVNEFGEVGVDGDLLSPSVPDIVEIRNGCLCCVTQDQLVPAIREVLAKYDVNVLLIEMSGAADSAPVAQQVNLLAPLVRLRAHVVMGDCTLPPEDATGDRSYCNSLSRAGVIALSKSDVADPGNVVSWRRFVGEFNSGALLLDVQKGEAGLDALLVVPAAETRSEDPEGHADHGYASIFRTVGDMSEHDLRILSERLGPQVVRMKGIVRIDGKWKEIQRVRTTLTVEPYEGAPPDCGRLVFISYKLFKRPMMRLVNECFPQT